jgi:hypothetical protein
VPLRERRVNLIRFSPELFSHTRTTKRKIRYTPNARNCHISRCSFRSLVYTEKQRGKTEKSDNSLKIALYQLANKKPSRALLRVCFFCWQFVGNTKHSKGQWIHLEKNAELCWRWKSSCCFLRKSSSSDRFKLKAWDFVESPRHRFTPPFAQSSQVLNIKLDNNTN